MSSEKWVESPVLETHIRWLLDQLEPRWDGVARILQSGVRADIFCYSLGRSAAPPGLSKETVRRAEAMGIK
jgi:hypothetical protein